MPDLSYPGPESIHRHLLDNGLIVLAYENQAAESVVIEGVVRAGALVEESDVAGRAHFTAEMLLRGAGGRSFEEIYEAIESVGASLEFESGRHTTGFSAGALAEDLPLLLQLLADGLCRPTFPEEQVESLRGELITSLQIQANDTRHRAGRAFRELLYEDHPYRLPVEGDFDSIAGLTRAALAEYHRDYFGPQGMIVTIVGAVAPAEALAQVEAAFGAWLTEARQMPAAPAAYWPAEIIRRDVDMPRKSQSDVVMGLPGPARAAEDYLEASMANVILGVFGMYGRLGKNVREEQGLAYYIHSRLLGGLGPSPWAISTGVAPDKVEQAISSILEEITRLQDEPIPAEELEDCQAYRTGALPVSLETNDGLAGAICDMELYELGLDYLQTLTEKIWALTPESVQAAARKYLSSEQIAIAVAGPQP
ncbi:MAG: M16 family metallopeptidase [Candidatus Promineifilaceae bacterium]